MANCNSFCQKSSCDLLLISIWCVYDFNVNTMTLHVGGEADFHHPDWRHKTRSLWLIMPVNPIPAYSISQEICTRFCCLCFVVVMQSFIMNSHEVFIHIHQGCFAGTGAIVRLPQCQWSKPDGYGKISQCITTTKHSKAKTVCIFLVIYCKWLGYVIAMSLSKTMRGVIAF